MFDCRYKKITSINEIRALGLNLHHTIISNSAVDIMRTAKEFQRFTIRTDKATEWKGGWGKGTELPFIIQETPLKNDEELFYRLITLSMEGFVFIIADGIKYDEIQDYNAVAKIQTNGDFIIEASTEKVPLRKMYSKESIFIAEGNITNEVSQLEFHNKTTFDRFELLKDMQDLYTKELFDKWIEFTRYPIKLGEKQDKFVFWQIRDR